MKIFEKFFVSGEVVRHSQQQGMAVNKNLRQILLVTNTSWDFRVPGFPSVGGLVCPLLCLRKLLAVRCAVSAIAVHPGSPRFLRTRCRLS
ncbi:MAG: hypothetical protein KatS3mg110_1096 [Pirellulaceae bacterium]|nr:MAG: hypothetical protein KatS3mg110_1096 [Pirellulaceae bacterium]